jgi:hypothetical protein
LSSPPLPAPLHLECIIASLLFILIETLCLPSLPQVLKLLEVAEEGARPGHEEVDPNKTTATTTIISSSSGTERYLTMCRRGLNHLAAGMALRRLERPQEALGEIELSLAAMANARAHLGELEVPLENPISASIWYERGITFCDLDRFGEGIAAFQEAPGYSYHSMYI